MVWHRQGSGFGLLAALMISPTLAPCAEIDPVDADRDGLDDRSRQPVTLYLRGWNDPLGSGPAHVVDLGALGVAFPVNSATWQSDERQPAPNGAEGFLWVGSTALPGAALYKIDTTIPAVVREIPLSVSPDGLAWDGRYLLVQTSADSGHSNTTYRIDPDSGAVVGSVDTPTLWPHGICWMPQVEDEPGEFTWQADFTVPEDEEKALNQVRYFTSDLRASHDSGKSSIGAVCDGWDVWTSNFQSATYDRFDPATGAPLGSLYVGGINGNPRDGAWDGHHLWDVTWVGGGWAWQWDLYRSANTYPVTVALTPERRSVLAETSPVFRVSVRNHTDTPWSGSLQLELFDRTGAGVHFQTRRLTVDPTTTATVDLGARFARPGSYLVRVVASGDDETPIHGDTAILEIFGATARE